MREVKRCSGYKGHWECSEEYPDHQVPVEQFGIVKDGFQGRCHKCAKYRDSIRNPIQDPIRSAVVEFAKSEGIVANRKEWRALPKSYRDEVTQRWYEECSEQDNQPSNVIHFKAKPKPAVTLKSTVRNDGLPKGIVTQSEEKVRREKKKIEYVPEGWIYAARDWMKQREEDYHKLGKTNDLERRLKEFNTAGDFEMMHWVKVSDVKKAEDMLHYHFRDQHHLREWFKVSLEDAIEAMDSIADKINNNEGDVSENTVSES